jgi:hypothetical protein
VVILINQNEKIGMALYENSILDGNTELRLRTTNVYTKMHDVYNIYDFRTPYT